MNFVTNPFRVNLTSIVPEGAKRAYNELGSILRKLNITPDDGTNEDIDWLMKYQDFGEYVDHVKPTWGFCDECHKFRLGTSRVVDLKRMCLSCLVKERVMQYVNELSHLDNDLVKNFLNTGKIDPTFTWTTYEEIFAREAKRTEEMMRSHLEAESAWNQAQMSSPSPMMPYPSIRTATLEP